MPIYTFKNNDTGQVFTESMRINQRESYLKNNPHIEQVLTTVSIGDSVRLGVRKTDDSFNDLLKYTKRRNPRSNIKHR